MKSILKLSLFLTLSVFLCPACTVETIEDDDPSFEISSQVAQGQTDANETFVTETALAEFDNPFGDDGYFFHLFGTQDSCRSFFNGDVRFFLETSADLEPGEYSGSGPFIGSTSYLGCDIIISEVTETTISGRVKGGNFDGDQFIEGAFEATICQ